MAFGDIKPEVSVRINGIQLGDGTSNFVHGVKVEQSVDKIDLLTLLIANPIGDAPGKVRDSRLLWHDSVAFMPGNVVEVLFSYGDSSPVSVGAGIIKKWLPQFPRDGVPLLTLKCFNGASEMMNGTDETVASDARVFGRGVSISDMVRQVIADYDIDPVEIDDVDTEPAVATIKKAGMTDYNFVKGLANLVGYEFFVTWNSANSRWQAHWRKPKIDDSDPKTFVWGPDYQQGSGVGLLHEFFPRFTIEGQSTDVQAFYFDRDTLTWEEVIYPPPKESKKKQTFRWRGDKRSVASDLQAIGTAESAAGLRIAAGGTAVEVLPETGFKSAEEALAFARAWWQKKQELLIEGQGTITGLATLRPNQIHELQGIGSLSGQWNFAEIEHNYRQGEGYTCKITARKVIP
jgi:phage protein D